MGTTELFILNSVRRFLVVLPDLLHMTEREISQNRLLVWQALKEGMWWGHILLFFSASLRDDVGSLSVLSWLKNEHPNLRGVVGLKSCMSFS